jgi:hypothetical protein
MGHAINLERDLGGSTIKIQYPIAQRMLTADFHIIRLKTQMPPEQGFRQARLRPELARQGYVARLLWPRQEPLRHWLRQCHLPVCAVQKRGGPEGNISDLARSSPFWRSPNGEVARRRRVGGVHRQQRTPPSALRAATSPFALRENREDDDNTVTVDRGYREDAP